MMDKVVSGHRARLRRRSRNGRAESCIFGQHTPQDNAYPFNDGKENGAPYGIVACSSCSAAHSKRPTSQKAAEDSIPGILLPPKTDE